MGGGQLVEAGHPLADRGEEALLLEARRFEQQLAARAQLGVDVAHRLDDALDDGRERRLSPSHQPRMPDGAAKDAAKDVAAPVVGGGDAVGEEKRDRAGVVGEHPVARRLRRILVRHPDDARDRVDQRSENVGVEVVRPLLHHGGNALEPGARVDRRLGERDEGAAGLPVELHEDEVPDLEEAPRLGALDEGVLGELLSLRVGPLPGRARGELPVAGDVGEIDVDLRAGTAGARVGHLPEVVLLAEAVDPGIGEAGDLLPEGAGLVVLVVDRDASNSFFFLCAWLGAYCSAAAFCALFTHRQRQYNRSSLKFYRNQFAGVNVGLSYLHKTGLSLLSAGARPLQLQRHSFIDYDAQNDRARRAEMFSYSGGDPTVPCIVEDGKYVGSGWGNPPRG